MKISLEGLSLIKKFEGCKLEAYYCSGGVLTIGYGHTGKVKETDVITQDEADRLLKGDILKFEQYVSDNVKVDLDQSKYQTIKIISLSQTGSKVTIYPILLHLC